MPPIGEGVCKECVNPGVPFGESTRSCVALAGLRNSVAKNLGLRATRFSPGFNRPGFQPSFQHAARFQCGFEGLAIFRGQRHEGQPVFLLADADHREGGFHGDGVGFHE